MRVLHVIPSLSPALGGPTVVVLNLVKELRQWGIDAEIVSTNDDGQNVLDVPLNQRVIYEQVPVWFLPRFPVPMKEFIFSAAMTRWLRLHVSDYNLLDNHYLFSYPPSCAGILARRRHIPYTVRTQGQLAPWALAQSQLKKRLYAGLLERRNLNQAAAIHCATAREAKDARQYGVSVPKVVLPLGIVPTTRQANARARLRRQFAIADDTPIVLFLSRLYYTKQPEVLLRSLQHLLSAGYKAHALIAGSGSTDYIANLQRLVTVLGLHNTVTFVGFVAGDRKQLLLQGADVFALPSLSESFSLATAEAMAAGLPVVVTPEVQIAPDIQTVGAGIVAKGTVEATAKAMSKLLANPELRDRMGLQGQRWAQQHYHWPTIAGQLAQVYKAIVHHQSIPFVCVDAE